MLLIVYVFGPVFYNQTPYNRLCRNSVSFECFPEEQRHIVLENRLSFPVEYLYFLALSERWARQQSSTEYTGRRHA